MRVSERVGFLESLKFFEVNSSEYVPGTDYIVVRPASINRPRDASVMFITTGHPQYRDVFLNVSGCLIFWPQEWPIPPEIEKRNAVYPCGNPHLSYGKFFAAHGITGLYPVDRFETLNGSWIAQTAKIGRNTTIFPGVYIGGQVEIGDDCFIGSGVRIVGRVKIGSRVWIRENTVIGTDGLSTDRDEAGHPVEIPQFGGVLIEDDVKIGANSVIQRGAIDDTVLEAGCKIDGQAFIAHNVHVGRETFVVGESFLLGSASVGAQSQVAAGCIFGNYVRAGDRALVGMGSVVTRDIPDNCVAYGVPAKPVRRRFEE